jgi:hypothetical protein
MPRSKKSTLQCASLNKINTINKESLSPVASLALLVPTSSLAALELDHKCERAQGIDYTCLFHLEVKKNGLQQAKNARLLAQAAQSKQDLVDTQIRLKQVLAADERMQKEKDALRKARECAVGQKAKAVEKGVKSVKTKHLQVKGVVPDIVHEGVCELAQMGVLTAQIAGVFSVVNESQGITMRGNLSMQTASQIVLEGGVGVALKVQLIEETQAAKHEFYLHSGGHCTEYCNRYHFKWQWYKQHGGQLQIKICHNTCTQLQKTALRRGS